jgi:hypothetical protein
MSSRDNQLHTPPSDLRPTHRNSFGAGGSLNQYRPIDVSERNDKDHQHRGNRFGAGGRYRPRNDEYCQYQPDRRGNNVNLFPVDRALPMYPDNRAQIQPRQAYTEPSRHHHEQPQRIPPRLNSRPAQGQQPRDSSIGNNTSCPAQGQQPRNSSIGNNTSLDVRAGTKRSHEKMIQHKASSSAAQSHLPRSDRQPSDSSIRPLPPTKPQPPQGPPGNTRDGDDGHGGHREQKSVATPICPEQNPRVLEYPTIELTDHKVDNENATMVCRGVLFCNPDTEPAARQVFKITNTVQEQLRAFCQKTRASFCHCSVHAAGRHHDRPCLPSLDARLDVI